MAPITPVLSNVATDVVAIAGILGLIRVWWKANRRLHKIVDLLEFVEAELRPNHGSSLRDAIDRLETELSDHIAYHMDRGEKNVQ